MCDGPGGGHEGAVSGAAAATGGSGSCIGGARSGLSGAAFGGGSLGTGSNRENSSAGMRSGADAQRTASEARILFIVPRRPEAVVAASGGSRDGAAAAKLAAAAAAAGGPCLSAVAWFWPPLSQASCSVRLRWSCGVLPTSPCAVKPVAGGIAFREQPSVDQAMHGARGRHVRIGSEKRSTCYVPVATLRLRRPPLYVGGVERGVSTNPTRGRYREPVSPCARC